jgi:hypothetical protein
MRSPRLVFSLRLDVIERTSVGDTRERERELVREGERERERERGRGKGEGEQLTR